MAERDYTNDWDDPNNPYGSNRNGQQEQDTGGLWLPAAPGYDPGPNWNGGHAPDPPAPRYDYNGGSPPDQALTPGHGWEWQGQQSPVWDMTTNQWNQGAWQEKSGGGLGYQAPTAPAPQQGPAFQPPAAAPQQQFSAPAQGGGGGGAPSAPPVSYKTPQITDEVTKMLLARLNELKGPQDLTGDKDYQNAIRAYQVSSLRGADKQRKALAERSAAGGTRSSGGFNVGVRGIAERQGENAAQYTSGLALDRLQQREQQLMEGIRIARSIGQDDIANQLEVQRLQLQQELGRGDLALRGELGRGQLELGRDNLGLSYADMVLKANRDATLAVL
jgi:hypothetical protein